MMVYTPSCYSERVKRYGKYRGYSRDTAVKIVSIHSMIRPIPYSITHMHNYLTGL